jgi:hypothetical protein
MYGQRDIHHGNFLSQYWLNVSSKAHRIEWMDITVQSCADDALKRKPCPTLFEPLLYDPHSLTSF